MDSMITIVAPIRRGDVDAVNAKIDALGNPCCTPVTEALDRLGADGRGTHFLSLHAIVSAGGGDAHLVFEITADGDAKAAIGRIDAAIGADLLPIFSMARDWREQCRPRRLSRQPPDPGRLSLFRSARPVLRRHAAYERQADPRRSRSGRVRLVGDRRWRVRRAADRPPRHGAPRGRRKRRVRMGARRRRRRRAAGAGTDSTLGLVFSLLGPFFRTYLWPFIFVLIAALAVAWLLIRPDAAATWLAIGLGRDQGAGARHRRHPPPPRHRRRPLLLQAAQAGRERLARHARARSRARWSRSASARISAPRTTWSRSPSASRASFAPADAEARLLDHRHVRDQGLSRRLPRRHLDDPRRPLDHHPGHPHAWSSSPISAAAGKAISRISSPALMRA